MCTGVFGKRDVGRIEREFLQVLNWDLSVSEDDILSHHHSIHSLYVSSLPDNSEFSLVSTSSADCSRSLDLTEHEISSWSDSDESSSDSSLSPITPPLNPSAHESYSRPTSSATPSRPCRPVMDLGLPSALDILNSFPLPHQWCLPAHGKGWDSQNIIPRSTQVWV